MQLLIELTIKISQQIQNQKMNNKIQSITWLESKPGQMCEKWSQTLDPFASQLEIE